MYEPEPAVQALLHMLQNIMPYALDGKGYFSILLPAWEAIEKHPDFAQHFYRVDPNLHGGSVAYFYGFPVIVTAQQNLMAVFHATPDGVEIANKRAAEAAHGDGA